MRVLFAIIVVVHGLLHVLGFAKAFGLAELPQLTRPISQFIGTLWLVAALLFVAAAASLFLWPRWEPVDRKTARATFTNAGHTIRGAVVQRTRYHRRGHRPFACAPYAQGI
jgi:hypothetical protein